MSSEQLRIKPYGCHWRNVFYLVALFASMLLVTACATPIGVVRGTTQDIHYALSANVLCAGTPSTWSKQVLHRMSLTKRFDVNRAAALNILHKSLAQAPSEERLQDRLFARAELSFLHAENSGEWPHYLAAAVYAYALLVPERGPRLDPIDPRVRAAADIDNRGLTRGLTTPIEAEVVLEAGSQPLPFGELVLTTDPEQFLWGAIGSAVSFPSGSSSCED